MVLNDWRDVLDAVSGVATICLSAASIYIAVAVHRWQKNAARVTGQVLFSELARNYNELVLRQPELQEIERRRHPFGELELSDVRKMFFQFLLLNEACTRFAAMTSDAHDKEPCEVSFKNLAYVMYADRCFIEQHCLPRGYAADFCSALQAEWARIDAKQSAGARACVGGGQL